MTENEIEKMAEKIAVMLLKAASTEEEIEHITNEAQTMAIRGFRGWWEIIGKPYYNKRLAKVKKKAKL